MPTIKKIVNRDILKTFKVPQEFGEEFEMILSSIMDEKENKELINVQKENNFSSNILMQDSEDVWNDI